MLSHGLDGRQYLNTYGGKPMKAETVKLNIEELEQRIAPSPTGSNAATNASSTGKSNGSTPEVPAGAHPQPNP
jgi:hypothetical protein